MKYFCTLLICQGEVHHMKRKWKDKGWKVMSVFRGFFLIVTQLYFCKVCKPLFLLMYHLVVFFCLFVFFYCCCFSLWFRLFVQISNKKMKNRANHKDQNEKPSQVCAKLEPQPQSLSKIWSANKHVFWKIWGPV